jgi:diguanylate cyclase (GGDEF)-like protein
MVAPDRVAVTTVVGYLDRHSRTALVVFGLLLVVLAGLLQYLTGSLAFLVYYLVPVGLTAWFVGRGAGMLTAGVAAGASAVAWAGANAAGRGPTLQVGVSLGTVTAQFLFFLVILAYVLATLKAALERAERLARTDYLTGVANARYFFELASAELARARRYERPLTLAYIDVDDFKGVNDRLGHSAGDAMLRVLAETVRSRIRNSDVIARLGGDEFALLLPETGPEAAEGAIEKLRTLLSDVARERGWPVTLSAGVVTCVGPPDVTLDDMIKAADRLMYSVKRSGKNQIRYEILGKLAAVQTPQEAPPA